MLRRNTVDIILAKHQLYVDIWALGVLLYKLCYYTTPFEDQGQLAILNARYSIPQYPVFSQDLIGLIG